MVKYGHDLLGHVTLQYDMSQKWIDELGWFMHADSAAIAFYYTANLLDIFYF